MWGRVGVVWGSFWDRCGVVWGALGAVFGSFFGPLGAFVNCVGVVFGAVCVVLGSWWGRCWGPVNVGIVFWDLGFVKGPDLLELQFVSISTAPRLLE